MGFLRRPQKSSSYFWQECHVLCAQQRTCQKVDEDFSKQMWTSRIIQTLEKSLIKIHPKDKVVVKWYRSFPRKSLRNETILLWYYSLSSFQEGDTKFERFLPKNQHTQRKLLNFKICTLFWICMAIWPGVPFDAFQIC